MKTRYLIPRPTGPWAYVGRMTWDHADGRRVGVMVDSAPDSGVLLSAGVRGVIVLGVGWRLARPRAWFPLLRASTDGLLPPDRWRARKAAWPEDQLHRNAS